LSGFKGLPGELLLRRLLNEPPIEMDNVEQRASGS
jgi:hypothetical protein